MFMRPVRTSTESCGELTGSLFEWLLGRSSGLALKQHESTPLAVDRPTAGPLSGHIVPLSIPSPLARTCIIHYCYHNVHPVSIAPVYLYPSAVQPSDPPRQTPLDSRSHARGPSASPHLSIFRTSLTPPRQPTHPSKTAPSASP